MDSGVNLYRNSQTGFFYLIRSDFKMTDREVHGLNLDSLLPQDVADAANMGLLTLVAKNWRMV